MKYQIIPVTPFQQNCSLIICEATGKAALIDPGGDIDRILTAVAAHQVTLEYLLLTHGHLDHVGAAYAMSQQFQIPILGPHRDDAFWLEMLEQQCQAFGFAKVKAFKPDRWLEDQAIVSIGTVQLKVLHCPGHTPGHVVFFCEQAGVAWVGDVLFHGSIGRTDFPRSDHQTLLRSIREQLWPLGPEVIFIPGHGPQSSFGEEMRHNPYVGCH